MLAASLNLVRYVCAVHIAFVIHIRARIFTKKAVVQAGPELGFIRHVVLNGGECGRAAKCKHYSAHRQKEILQAHNS